MKSSVRAVALPIAIGIPLLGILVNVIDPIMRGALRIMPPWRNPNALLWCLWGLCVPLVLRLEERFPLRRPNVRAVFAHACAIGAIVAVRAAITTFLLPHPLTNVRQLAFFERLPRFLPLDLLVYGLIVIAGYALRTHAAWRDRERADAELEAEVRRAEVERVRTTLDPDLIFRELRAIRAEIDISARAAEARIESLSDHLERQINIVAARAPRELAAVAPTTAPSRRWIALVIAPFVFIFAVTAIPIITDAATGAFEARRFARTLAYPFLLLPAVAIVVAAARRLHFAVVLLLCIPLPFLPDAIGLLIEGHPLTLVARSRMALLNRFFLIGVAAAVIAAQYADRLRARAIRESLLRARLADAQLNALRMQLHPHFLFNTLNAIAGLLEEDRATAALMTERLEEFLRISLTLGDAHEVPLREELRFTKTYLDIQEARFGDRLRVTISAPGKALDAMVPALVLQPLVENAIHHGIGQRKRGGTIHLSAIREADDIVIRVRDDGEGAQDASGNGVGLSNTRARMQQLYGAKHSVTIRTAPGEGFEIELRHGYRTHS